MRRRALLRGVGASAAALIGGCASPLRADSVRLGYLDVGNWDDEPHRFDVRVIRDGTRVHASAHELAGRDENRIRGTAVDCTWGREPAAYTVAARMDHGDWRERSLVPSDTHMSAAVDCVVVGVWNRGGDLGFQIGSGCKRDYDGMCAFTQETTSD